MTKFPRNLCIVLILYFGLLTSYVGICHSIQEESTKLRLVSAVFRHGDRTVDTEHHESYPNDPYKDFDYYPDGSGQLTITGKRRAYQLGLTLRNRYNRFLGNVYYQPNVYAHSTTVVRTKMTLQLVLTALYPPFASQKWNPLLLWQPTDYTYETEYQDDVLFAVLCPIYHRLYYDIIQNDMEVKTKVADFADLMKEVSIYSGRNITTVYQLWLIYNTLAAESNFGLLLPAWTRNLFPNGKLLDASILQFDLFSYGKLNKHNGGILLRRIINDMDEVINGTLTERKINLFSAHDINVAAILHALNIYDEQIPQFTSSVIIELHERNNEFFVKVIHYLGIPSKVLEKSIPGCEILCPYDKFIQLTSTSTAKNEDLECPEKLVANFDF